MHTYLLILPQSLSSFDKGDDQPCRLSFLLCIIITSSGKSAPPPPPPSKWRGLMCRCSSLCFILYFFQLLSLLDVERLSRGWWRKLGRRNFWLWLLFNSPNFLACSSSSSSDWWVTWMRHGSSPSLVLAFKMKTIKSHYLHIWRQAGEERTFDSISCT